MALSGGPLRLVPVLALLLASPSGAIRPVSHYHDLVAGSFSPGFRDGPFAEARFSSPVGLAVSPDGTRLYVADRDNNRIRVVLLAEGNRVETVAGTGEASLRDGILRSAALDHPYLVALLPGEKLVVVEAGERLRLVDLKAGAVREIAIPGRVVHGVFALVASPSGALYASSPEERQVYRVDVATSRARPLLPPGSTVKPTGLCLCGAAGDRLAVADAAGGRVFFLGSDGRRETVGNVTGVRALACQGDRLWALRADPKTPLVVLSPRGDATPRSVWGPVLSQEKGEQMPVLADPAGLVVDPREERRLFVASPLRNVVGSVRDYDFAGSVNSEQPQPDGLTDFAYPRRKPPATVRLLLAGDSRSFYVSEREKVASGGRINRMQVLAKRLELFLDAEAALAGRRESVQVLSVGRVSWEPLFLWPATDVPPLATAYDVDRVLVLVGPDSALQFTAWYDRPLGPDGLPTRALDGEFTLRAPRERVQPGRPSKFFRDCEARGLVKVLPKSLEFAELPRLAADPALRPQIVELLGEPLGALSRRLVDGSGRRRELTLVYLPKAVPEPDDVARDVWRAVSARYSLPLLDLSAEMHAFGVSFSPLSELDGYDHFTVEGTTLLGWLLARRLEGAGYLSPARSIARAGDAAPPAPVR